MKKLISRMHGGQGGFTLIELLVVIAILGVIAAIVALNVASFFGRGTLQAAKTELHQAQTAIISAMADAESNRIVGTNATLGVLQWAGASGVITIVGTDGTVYDASSYIYGPFRAMYSVNVDADHATRGIGQIFLGDCDPATSGIANPWGTSIEWDQEYMNWATAP